MFIIMPFIFSMVLSFQNRSKTASCTMTAPPSSLDSGSEIAETQDTQDDENVDLPDPPQMLLQTNPTPKRKGKSSSRSITDLNKDTEKLLAAISDQNKQSEELQTKISTVLSRDSRVSARSAWGTWIGAMSESIS